jgi:SAM-dependent methyltransferase
MLKRLKKLYIQEQFNPKILGLFINPFYFARKGLYQSVSVLILNLKGKLLDVGCGTKPYEGMCNVDKYIGLEIDDEVNRNHSFADVFYDGSTIPFKDKEFDSILSNQVFEHVFNPHVFLREINRVTKMDGLFLITVPFVWDEHEQPYDYARYSSFGLRHVLAENGFDIMEHRKSNNGVEVIFQLINDYIYKVTITKNNIINLLITLFLMAPVNVTGLILSKILPRNDDLYLDNIILARKTQDV